MIDKISIRNFRWGKRHHNTSKKKHIFYHHFQFLHNWTNTIWCDFYIHCKTVSNFHQAQICIFHERSINRSHTIASLQYSSELNYWILGRFCRFESWKICENISHRTSYSLVSVPYMAGMSNYVHLCKQGWVRLTTMLKVF